MDPWLRRFELYRTVLPFFSSSSFSFQLVRGSSDFSKIQKGIVFQSLDSMRFMCKTLLQLFEENLMNFFELVKVATYVIKCLTSKMILYS